MVDISLTSSLTLTTDSQEAGVSYRWDGLPLRRTPAVATLPTSLRESIAAATRLDRSLYMRAVSEP